MKRFIERFQLWIHEFADDLGDKVPRWLVFLAVVMIASDAFTFVRQHQLSWDSVLGTGLFIAFVVLYLRQARWTWVIMLVLAIRCFATVPFAHIRLPADAPVGARIFAIVFTLGLALFAFFVSLVIRKRFEKSHRTI